MRGASAQFMTPQNKQATDKVIKHGAGRVAMPSWNLEDQFFLSVSKPVICITKQRPSSVHSTGGFRLLYVHEIAMTETVIRRHGANPDVGLLIRTSDYTSTDAGLLTESYTSNTRPDYVASH